MKTLRLQLRFLVPLIATLVCAALVAVPLMDQLTLRWFARDLNIRGQLVTNTLAESIIDAQNDGKSWRLQSMFERAARDERLIAIALCSADNMMLRQTAGVPKSLDCARAREIAEYTNPRLDLASGAVHVGVHSLEQGNPKADLLVLLHDLSFIDKRSQDTRRYLIAFIVGLGLTIALITVIVAQLSWRGWVRGMQGILRGEGLLLPLLPPPELQPFASEVRARLRDLEDEYRRGLELVSEWNPERLRSLLHTQLRGDQVIVVSNREPYIHERNVEGEVIAKQPASGLVTAVEPVMRACSGTWIAHGSGSADRDVVDSRDRVAVPPGANDYTLRRIWLTPEEEQDRKSVV